MKHRLSLGDKLLSTANYAILLCFGSLVLYPFINITAISLSHGLEAARGGITLFPKAFTFDNYELVFKSPNLLGAYKITVLRTIVGTLTSVLFTAMFAYGLSYRGLVGHKFYMWVCLVSMYFSGGLIPFYLLIRSLHLLDSFWVYIVPGLLSVFNMIVMRTFFSGIPEGLEESANLDGAGDFRIFFSIILPISKPILATIALFNGVGHWNAWFDANLFIQNQDLLPMQTILMQVINSASVSNSLASDGVASAMRIKYSSLSSVSLQTVRAATMLVTIVPIVMIYPFLQKYFVKGVMIGSLKG